MKTSGNIGGNEQLSFASILGEGSLPEKSFLERQVPFGRTDEIIKKNTTSYTTNYSKENQEYKTIPNLFYNKEGDTLFGGFERKGETIIVKVEIQFNTRKIPLRIKTTIGNDTINILGFSIGKTQDRDAGNISISWYRFEDMVSFLTGTKQWEYFNSHQKKVIPLKSLDEILTENTLSKNKLKWKKFSGIAFNTGSKILENNAFLEFKIAQGEYVISIEYSISIRKSYIDRDEKRFLDNFKITGKQKKDGKYYPEVKFIPTSLLGKIIKVSRQILLDPLYNKYLPQILD